MSNHVMVLSAVLSNTTIVIVEDHAEFRTMLGRFLTWQGAWVVAASDAFDGIKAVRERRPDVVLLDVSLPNRDGFRVLRDIRELGLENGGNVPVVAMTAFARIVDRNHASAAGFQAHLEKPFGPDQLLEAIKSVLKN